MSVGVCVAVCVCECEWLLHVSALWCTCECVLRARERFKRCRLGVMRKDKKVLTKRMPNILEVKKSTINVLVMGEATFTTHCFLSFSLSLTLTHPHAHTLSLSLSLSLTHTLSHSLCFTSWKKCHIWNKARVVQEGKKWPGENSDKSAEICDARFFSDPISSEKNTFCFGSGLVLVSVSVLL